MIDPTGFLLTTLRADPGITAITTRIRAGEPAGKDASEGPDALGPGKYRPFVVLVQLGRVRLPRAPLQEVRYAARCYGVTFQGATELAGAVSDAIHARGHRISGSGVAITGTMDDGGGEPTKDPDTGQPYETVVISVGALTVPV